MKIAAALKEHETDFLRAADGLATAVAVSLPWSTSATSILVVAWLLALLPTLDLRSFRREIATPAGLLPILLFGLAALGMLWSPVSWSEAARGVAPFAKLLAIPLLLIQFRRSERGLYVLGGFFVSCGALLLLSSALAVWPALTPHKSYGVPVKDYIAQAGEFVLCGIVAAYLAGDFFKAGRRHAALGWAILSALFLIDVLYVATSRTALVTLPVLFVLIGWRQSGWKGAVGYFVAATLLAGIIWGSSPYLRHRVTNVGREVQAYEVAKDVTSSGERLFFWKNSLRFIAAAPLIGHGTGSIKHMFEKAVANETGGWAKPSTNPHNQILAVGIQLGFLGIAVLIAMWLSHLLLFRAPGLVASIGVLVVVQNVISSLFNSHIFDFTEGWIYVFGVGIAGGAVLRAGAGLPQHAETERQAASGGEPPIAQNSGVQP